MHTATGKRRKKVPNKSKRGEWKCFSYNQWNNVNLLNVGEFFCFSKFVPQVRSLLLDTRLFLSIPFQSTCMIWSFGRFHSFIFQIFTICITIQKRKFTFTLAILSYAGFLNISIEHSLPTLFDEHECEFYDIRIEQLWQIPLNFICIECVNLTSHYRGHATNDFMKTVLCKWWKCKNSIDHLTARNQLFCTEADYHLGLKMREKNHKPIWLLDLLFRLNF